MLTALLAPPLGSFDSMPRNRTFKFLSWNVRGLNGSSKCAAVKVFLRGCKCGVVCLQETKLSTISLDKFRSFCGFTFGIFVRSRLPELGGILTAWNPALFECVDFWVGSFSVNTVLLRRVDGTSFTISNVYGPTRVELKGVFLQELRDLESRVVGVWTLLGDFNLLFSCHDKNGPLANATDTLSFRNVISSLGLLDIPLSNRAFTWSNGRACPILERLDRAFVSRDWQLHFPRSSLKALARPCSDHSPLLLTAYSFVPAPQLFRFESFWLRYRGASDLIGESWVPSGAEGDPALRFASKLSSLSGKLKDWSAGLSPYFSRLAALCLSWIEWLDKAEEFRLLGAGEVRLRCQLRERFDELSLQIEMKWKQRSRIQWLKVGDSNSKFFHAFANTRRNQNYISSIAAGPNLLSGHASIASHLFSFFKQQLGAGGGGGLRPCSTCRLFMCRSPKRRLSWPPSPSRPRKPRDRMGFLYYFTNDSGDSSKVT